MLFQALVFGLILPAFVTSGVLVLGRGSRWSNGGRLVWNAPALAVTTGYVAAHVALHGFRGVLPADVMQRLPLAGAAFAMVGLADGPHALLPRRAALDLVASGLAAYLLVEPLQGRSLGARAIIMGTFAASSVLLMRLSTSSLAAKRPRRHAIELSGLLLAGGGLSFLSGTALVGQLGVAAAAAAGGLIAYTWLARETCLDSAGRPLAGMFVSVLALSFLYAEMRPAVLAAGAAAAVALLGLPLALRNKPVVGTVLGVVVALGLMIFAAAASMNGATLQHPNGAPLDTDTTDTDYGYR